MIVGLDRRVHDRGLHDPLRLPHVLRRVPGGRRPAARARARTSRRPARSRRRRSSRARPCPRRARRSPASSTPPASTRAVQRSGSSQRTWSWPPSVAARHDFKSVGRADARRSRLVRRHRATASVLLASTARAFAQGPRPSAASVGPRRLHASSSNKYYLDDLYENVIVGGINGPDRPGRVLDQPERHRRRRQRRRHRRHATSADFIYNVDRPAGGRRRRQRRRLRRRGRGRPAAPHADRQGAAVRRRSCSARPRSARLALVIFV